MTAPPDHGPAIPRSAAGLSRTRGRTHLVLLAMLCFTALALLGARAAEAYPQWQMLTGSVRCSQCHFSPTGGGLVTNYGRDLIGEEQTSFGGNGAFLHGAAPLPNWLALGGDLRGAYVAHDVQDPAGTKQAVFPMQMDLQLRAAVDDFSFYGSVGVRGQARDNSDVVPTQNYQPIDGSRLISREHYLMWRSGSLGPYVRGGRFYVPYGLRMAEHVLYVRRDLGLNQLEESYAISGGRVSESSEFHLTCFAPDFWRHIGGRTWGLAAYGERRFLDDTLMGGLQAKVDVADGTTRLMAGVVAKRLLATSRNLIFVEGNIVGLFAPDATSPQFVGLLGDSWMPGRGFMFTALAERRQTDLRVGGTATNGAALLMNWFPYAHFEVVLMGRLQFPSGQDTAKTFLAQLHYVL